MAEALILEGSISVQAALDAGRREIQVIYFQQGKEIRAASSIRQAAGKQGIEVKSVSADEIDALAKGKTHGGVLALAGERKFQTLNELVAGRPEAFVDRKSVV